MMGKPTSDCAIDDTPVSEPTISEKEMMIRGMSTFLAVTGQQLKAPISSSETDQGYRDIRRMDRLATLFVCQDKADVVAVAVAHTGAGMKVYSVQEPGSEESGQSEDPRQSDEPEVGKSEEPRQSDEPEVGPSRYYTIRNSRGNDKKISGAAPQLFLPPQVLHHSSGKPFRHDWLAHYLKGKS